MARVKRVVFQNEFVVDDLIEQGQNHFVCFVDDSVVEQVGIVAKGVAEVLFVAFLTNLIDFNLFYDLLGPLDESFISLAIH